MIRSRFRHLGLALAALLALAPAIAAAQYVPGPRGMTGPQGPRGATGAGMLSGPGAPTNDVGSNGDFYIDSTGYLLYGPKAGGQWPAGSYSLGLSIAQPVSPILGGTGTGTAFTPGSLVYAGPSGVYRQDNANLNWDDTNHTLGIGTLASASVRARFGGAFASGSSVTGVMSSTVAPATASGAVAYYGAMATATGSWTLPSSIVYGAYQGSIGGGSTVTNQYAFLVGNGFTGGTNNYGFYGGIGAGTGRYNLYMAGSADNYLGGRLGVGSSTLGDRLIGLSLPITGATNAYGVVLNSTVQPDVTVAAFGYHSSTTTAAASFTLPSLRHFRASPNPPGAGSSITDQFGFIAESSLTGASNNYGFYSALPNGTGRWNFFAAGTAPNHFEGNTSFGAGATFKGATSGTTTVLPAAIASGTLTLPAATDTLVGRATSDTLTNKTISGSSNTISNLAPTAFNGGTGANVSTFLRGDGTWAAPGNSAVPGLLYGLTMSTAGASTTLAVSAGRATDSTASTTMALATPMSKTTAAWSAGTGNGCLDTGTIANNTWYHWFLIATTSLSSIDLVCSTSATAPTLPGGYTLFRRIGSMKTNGSGQWIDFVQRGDYFYIANVLDFTTASSSSSTLRTLTVPTGIVVQPLIGAYLSASSNSSTMYAAPAANANVTMLVQNMSIPSGAVALGGTPTLGPPTNTSAQVFITVTTAATVQLYTSGWKDTRGRDG